MALSEPGIVCALATFRSLIAAPPGPFRTRTRPERVAPGARGPGVDEPFFFLFQWRSMVIPPFLLLAGAFQPGYGLGPSRFVLVGHLAVPVRIPSLGRAVGAGVEAATGKAASSPWEVPPGHLPHV